MVKELFTEEAGLSNYPNISWNDFTAFCNTCQLVSEPLSLSTIDRIFIATNVTLHEYSSNASRDLTRYEFLEILVRIANEKYKNVLEPHKAIQSLLSDYVFKYRKIIEPKSFRMEHIFMGGNKNKTNAHLVPVYIKKNDQILKNFYNTFIHGVKNYFTCKDALEMCLKVKLKISEKSITYAYS